MVRETVTVQESWVYHCGHCQHVWREDFEVHHADDGHGGDAACYYRNGERSIAPTADRVCGNCRSYSITARPYPHERHEPLIPPPVKPYDLELIFRMRRLHAY